MPEMELADQLREMADTAVSDQRIDDQDLVRILRFVSSVVVVVGQAFDDVLATLIELSYVSPDHLQESRRTELLADLDRVVQISRYKHVEEICSRLHALSEHYELVIKPKLGGLADEDAWSEVFQLLHEHEGKIILLVRDRVAALHDDFAGAKTADLPRIRTEARAAREEIQGMLEKLWDLRNRTLGLSGRVGLLELIETGQRPGTSATA